MLMRVLGLCDSLSKTWEGPLDVVKVINRVNYQVRCSERKGDSREVHINNLKMYVERDKNVFRVIVTEESEDGKEVRVKRSVLSERTCEEFDEAELNGVQNEYGTFFLDRPECGVITTEASTLPPEC